MSIEKPEASHADERRLATLPRGDSDELRITWSVYKEKPYVGIRLWTKGGNDGEMIPTRKGCSVRLRELPAVVEALTMAIKEAAKLEAANSPQPKAGAK